MILTKLRQAWLLIFSLLISFMAFWQMMMRANGSVPSRYLIALGVIAALSIVLSILLGYRLPRSAQAILPCILLLSALGITMITRIDLETIANGGASDVGMRQVIWVGIAIAVSAVLILVVRDYRQLRKFSYTSMVIGIVLLLSPMIPGLGREINGARIWIHVGSYSLQPAEFAKLFLAVFFAAYLFDHRDTLSVGGPKILGIRFPRIKDFGPILVVWIISMGVLVLQHDLGTSLLFFAMFVGMLYVATGRKSWIIIGGVFFAVGVVLAARIFSNFSNRVTIWLHPFDQTIYNRKWGSSYQVVQGLFGLATGGLMGTGLGRGHPSITPFANSDFIYASLGEELGLTGLIVILVLYLIIIGAGFITAMKIKDGFGKLLVSGLVFSMAFQVFVVVGGITLVIPLTGLTLPYIAAGGSSLIANWLLAALILIISNAANRADDEDAIDDTAFRMEAIKVLHRKEHAR
ncbi:MAG: FtsW/RodA/SpoVE family cell cycle protein [Bifidobacteriaceae bacterium]|jgi:cell division protein FtsW (lipid II flippase)|nr:FtsW/RodA/SpoVE family cell cycle protein [Bifidobacteriaceae bacterium]MCI1979202.1 FtsW/RodA/SpoVE family cell cycle protein [Bifidobacteriaceae bacterium]